MGNNQPSQPTATTLVVFTMAVVGKPDAWEPSKVFDHRTFVIVDSANAAAAFSRKEPVQLDGPFQVTSAVSSPGSFSYYHLQKDGESFGVYVFFYANADAQKLVDRLRKGALIQQIKYRPLATSAGLIWAISDVQECASETEPIYFHHGAVWYRIVLTAAQRDFIEKSPKPELVKANGTGRAPFVNDEGKMFVLKLAKSDGKLHATETAFRPVFVGPDIVLTKQDGSVHPSANAPWTPNHLQRWLFPVDDAFDAFGIAQEEVLTS